MEGYLFNYKLGSLAIFKRKINIPCPSNVNSILCKSFKFISYPINYKNFWDILVLIMV